LAVAAIAFAARTIAAQWQAFRASGAELEPRWLLVVASSAIVFVAYAILIETWRRTVRAWDNELPWTDAARIWFISNLGRYIPGKVWQIGAMGIMAQRAGVSPIAATGSAIVINLVNLLAGFGLAAATGAEFFEYRTAAIALSVALVISLVLAPRILPLGGRAAAWLLRRPLVVPRLPDSAIWIASVGCLAAWILYGIAFQIFVAGLLGSAPGKTVSYVAAFTGSYLLGYIALFAPGGLGVREGFLVAALARFGLAQAGAAGIIAVASRLWLTVLEVLPGVCFLAFDAVARRRLTLKHHDPNA
jgi:glycosyltransferase 2 family protein